MNVWVKKSIDLAYSDKYLDRLLEIYPVGEEIERKIPRDLIEDVKVAYEEKDDYILLESLLKLPRFPMDYPYAESLRRIQNLHKNPAVVDQIARRLFKMEISTILKLASIPKSPTRQYGASFKKWLVSLDIPYLPSEEIFNKKGVYLLSGSDTSLKNFVINKLGINLQKGIDIVLKVGEKFVIGEAKFLTHDGGTQNNQFNIALDLASRKSDKAFFVAVLDGVLWFESGNYMNQTIRGFEDHAMSALLLPDFIKSL